MKLFNIFNNDILNSDLLEIIVLPFLRVRELSVLLGLSKAVNAVVGADGIWMPKLTAEGKQKVVEQVKGLEKEASTGMVAKRLFFASPEMRLPQYVPVDPAGRGYLHRSKIVDCARL